MLLTKIGLILIVSCFAVTLRAEDPHPKAPAGWVEMNSIEPVILTWVKADPTKKLEEVPSAMVQQFPRNEKFVKFMNERPLDRQGCRSQVVNGWNQIWCLRPNSVIAILHRGQTETIPDQLKKWALTHD